MTSIGNHTKRDDEIALPGPDARSSTTDGLSAAANVLAVLDLMVRVASPLFQFSKQVKVAKSDIERLKGALDRLDLTLKGG
jgi:hypothetical protein